MIENTLLILPGLPELVSGAAVVFIIIYMIGVRSSKKSGNKAFEKIARSNGYAPQSEVDAAKAEIRRLAALSQKHKESMERAYSENRRSIFSKPDPRPIPKQIEDLKADFEAGKISEIEYDRRLNDLLDQL
ncbi:hypothetical protein [Pedobacter sp. SYP-B3415]|uniref:hypothetical protein n=1 Tax=Pedobacter sp. SYP-B3415 TaxID=2496641 RepID=UPI00101DDFA2|nr:hypothetical protein [Pedobacter sp. SYP-B3415]